MLSHGSALQASSRCVVPVKSVRTDVQLDVPIVKLLFLVFYAQYSFQDTDVMGHC